MRERGEDDAKGMVIDIEGVWSLGGRGMSRPIRDGICVCVVVVVVEVALVVEAVLIVVMGVMVLMIVRVACVSVVGMVGVLCIGVFEGDCV